MNVLIVDDVPANLYALRDILMDISAGAYRDGKDEDESLEILQANSGDEALKMLLQSDVVPVLAILDVQMPIMDGFETCKRIHAYLNEYPYSALASQIKKESS